MSKIRMKYISPVIIILILNAVVGISQECPGGLGSNLFSAGDFGTGESFVVNIDPMLAPGYSYNRSGPPNDGQYMITNDVAEWSFVWDTWLVIGDNSTDPDGYMMVVNASFEPGLFYEEVIEGLCDNTTYEFSADIINMIRRGVSDHSDPNVVFLIDNNPVLNTGDIPKNEVWNTYSFSFDTDPGQTEVRLSLRNNAPGGTGNDLALDNISFRACGPKSEIALVDGATVVCAEDLPVRMVALLNGIEEDTRTYQWEVSHNSGIDWSVIHGEESSRAEYNETALSEPIFRFATSASPVSFTNEKCRFYSEPFSVFISQREYEVFDTICGGTGLDFGNATLINPGLYIQDLMSDEGCDSIVMIHLDTIKREILTGTLMVEDPACFGDESGSITAQNIMGGYPPYHLDVNGRDEDDIVASGLPSGNYDILIEDRFNCFFEIQVILNDPEKLVLNLGPDLDLILGEEVHIDLTSNYILRQINWSGINQDFNDQTSFTFLPIDDTIIIVNGITDDGCEGEDMLSIKLDTEVSVYIPNIFSPNADLTNDQYYISPFGKSLGRIILFTIYDRWGGKVYQHGEGHEQWDGTDQKGQLVSPGNYTFTIEGELINGTTFRESGTILIIR